MRRFFGSLLSLIVLSAFALGAQGAATDVEFWFGEGNQNYVDAMPQLIADYERLHPDVSIKLVLKGHCSNLPYMEGLQTAIAGGAPPDMAYLDGADIFAWSLMGLVQPLDPYLTEQTRRALETGLMPGPQMEMRREASWYGVPFRFSTAGLYSSVDLFEEAGFDSKKGPTSLADLGDLAQKLTKVTDTGAYEVVGFIPNGNNWGDGLCWLWAFGGEYFDYSAGELTLLGVSSHLAALDWIMSYAQRYGGQTKGSAAGFAAGKFAMFIHSTTGLTQFPQLNPKIDFWTTPVPTAAGVAPFSLGFSLGPAVPVGAKQPGAAAQFMAHLGSASVQTAWYKMTRALPAHTASVQAIARLITDDREWNLVQQLPLTRVLAPLYPQLRQIWRPALEQMRRQEISPQAVLEKVEREMSPLYNQLFAGP